jgi:hypothetical protein
MCCALYVKSFHPVVPEYPVEIFLSRAEALATNIAITGYRHK